MAKTPQRGGPPAQSKSAGEKPSTETAKAPLPLKPGKAEGLTAQAVLRRYHAAMARRQNWESLWQDCYDFALPLRDGGLGTQQPGQLRTDRLFEGTAPDAVDQLAASLLAELTPPWAEWFGFRTGPHVDPEDRAVIEQGLSEASELLRANFDRSNFAVEIHQAYLDLVTVGTACLMFESGAVGDASAYRFTAVPIGETAFEEDAQGQLTTTFRRSLLTVAQFQERFPKAKVPERFENRDGGLSAGPYSEADRIPVIEAVLPEGGTFTYMAILESDAGSSGTPEVLRKGQFQQSPFIVFRWMKAPGEIYGRSPVMKCLPDIKTANKVVELVLKNATIAVTGIWQADDDGVLNPANIRLVPGTIIPKAVGSAGLVPLETPGRFDTGNIIMDELRARIKHALLADRLGQVEGPKMTATEVLERSAEMGRILGATFGRLQSELLTPLVLRAYDILIRRGVLEPIEVDGQVVELEYKSPLARQQASKDIRATLDWMQHLSTIGPGTAGIVDHKKAALWFARMLGVPREIILDPDNQGDAGISQNISSPDNPLPPGLSSQPPDMAALMSNAQAFAKQLEASGADMSAMAGEMGPALQNLMANMGGATAPVPQTQTQPQQKPAAKDGGIAP